jgi:cation diffusion facilitator family transporter
MNLPTQDDTPDPAFPKPIPQAQSVDAARQQRLRDLTQVTLLGIGIRMCVIWAELIGVAWFHSASLFVDAVASVFDVAASLVLILAMRFAARPPDSMHPFGRGRAEPLAGFQLGLLLLLTGVWLGWQNLLPLGTAAPANPLSPWAWTIPAGATLLLAGARRGILAVGIRTRSSAMQAEAMHFRSDALTSLLTAVTLIIAALVPDWSSTADHLGGFLLALTMVALGQLAMRDNLHQLLDRAPETENFERVRRSALKVPGVMDVEKLRIQHAGPDAHVNIDIEVQPEISVDESHRIAQQVRARIQTEWPFVREVVVHVEPYYAGDH